MNKRVLLVFLLFLSIFVLSCSSNDLPEYEIDKFDAIPINFEYIRNSNGSLSEKDDYKYYSITNELFEECDSSTSSESNTFMYVLNSEIEEEITVEHYLKHNIYHESLDDNYASYITVLANFQYKDVGYNKLSFLNRFNCTRLFGIPNHTIHMKVFMIPYVGELGDGKITFEHFKFKNYKEHENDDDQVGKFYYNMYMTNIYLNGVKIGKVGWQTYNKKPLTDLVERIFNENARIYSIEDLNEFVKLPEKKWQDYQ